MEKLYKILILDDEPLNVELLDRLLRKEYEVIKTYNCEEGFKVLNEQKDISIIIADQRMTDIKGVEFLRRTISLSPNSERILLTGYTDKLDMLDAINIAKISWYITKPINIDDVRFKVKKSIENIISKNRELIYKKRITNYKRDIEEAKVLVNFLKEDLNYFQTLLKNEKIFLSIRRFIKLSEQKKNIIPLSIESIFTENLDTTTHSDKINLISKAIVENYCEVTYPGFSNRNMIDANFKFQGWLKFLSYSIFLIFSGLKKNFGSHKELSLQYDQNENNMTLYISFAQNNIDLTDITEEVLSNAEIPEFLAAYLLIKRSHGELQFYGSCQKGLSLEALTFAFNRALVL